MLIGVRGAVEEEEDPRPKREETGGAADAGDSKGEKNREKAVAMDSIVFRHCLFFP